MTRSRTAATRSAADTEALASRTAQLSLTDRSGSRQNPPRLREPLAVFADARGQYYYLSNQRQRVQVTLRQDHMTEQHYVMIESIRYAARLERPQRTMPDTKRGSGYGKK